MIDGLLEVLQCILFFILGDFRKTLGASQGVY